MIEWYLVNNNYIITAVYNVYQFSQSIARQKIKLQSQAIMETWLT